jgi:hypothetical protein
MKSRLRTQTTYVKSILGGARDKKIDVDQNKRDEYQLLQTRN